MLAAAARTGRDVGTYVLLMVIADETDEAAMAKWRHYNDGADTAALAELGAMILLVTDARVSTRAEVRTAMRELAHVHDDVIGCVLDNVGRARRLPPASSAAAMRRIDERANASPEPERETTSIQEGH